ncbi:hypothetical protein N8T08_007940 [Aspergillus melleus]|uniref:Uncharacterized protein n=1 Tax=Aspergillus melleus TaxID=138277 RepID=A0ACC3AX13_9EURO|nr:hypothetical protein N8T08_007940 [Aspergillus melleus]
MAVRDDLFEPRTIDDFHATVQPKVAGLWNLHRALPEELDFFVLLASAGGIIGTRGQTDQLLERQHLPGRPSSLPHITQAKGNVARPGSSHWAWICSGELRNPPTDS